MPQTSPTGTDRRGSGAPSTGRCRGFTLAEILIVLTLVVTLTAMLTPLLLPSPGKQLREASVDIATTLRETRRLAQADQRRARFIMDTESGQYGTEGRSQVRRLPDGINAELTTAQSLLLGDSGGGIDFFPDGSSTGGRVVLGLDDYRRQVDIEWLTGRIRVSDVPL